MMARGREIMGHVLHKLTARTDRVSRVVIDACARILDLRTASSGPLSCAAAGADGRGRSC
jgi:hypothetical protein